MSEPVPTSPHPVLPRHRAIFRAIATTVVPEAMQLDGSAWTDVERIVEGLVAARPRAMQRQLGAFLRVVELAPLVRYGRRFTALDAVRRRAVLEWLQSAPLLLVRRGFWGVRTLALAGYYARPEAARAIGYAAHRDGWRALAAR